MSLFQFKNSHKYTLFRCLGAILSGITLFSSSLTVQAGVKEDNMAANQSIAIESNQIIGWPQGPVVSARSAILMEAETGTILYAKNIHNLEYPASTTKILTTLIASEECAMDELVTFSHDAIYDTPYDSNHIALDVGESLPIEQCLQAILIRSANEVSFGVAEHISESDWEDFAPIMNERAKELGAINSNFVNPNGLPDENHVTTAYDLAMIGRAFFANEILCNMTTTKMLDIPASDTQPDHIMEVNQMSLLRGKEYAYEYLVGCKTGYTNAARSSLVSCAEKDGLKLICVVLRDEAPYQYEDTIALFEYGFSNFKKLNVAENDTHYNINSHGLFYSDNDVLGNSKPILSLNTEDYIVVPNTIEFKDIHSTLCYDTDSEMQAALVTYTYHDWPVGTASIDFTGDLESNYEFDPADDMNAQGTPSPEDSVTIEDSAKDPSASDETVKETASVFARIGKVLLTFLLSLLAVAAMIIAILFIRRSIIIRKRRNRRRRRTQSLSFGNDPYASLDRSTHYRSQIANAKHRQRAAESRRRHAKRNRRWR